MREEDLTPKKQKDLTPKSPLPQGGGTCHSPLLLVGKGGQGDDVFRAPFSPPWEKGVGGMRGFTLVELLIVLSIMGVLTIPLVGIYILPLRTHANMAAMTKTSLALQQLDAHLADDIRCADALELWTDAEGKPELAIQRGPEKVVYRNTGGVLVRITEGAVPLKFHFSSIRAEFIVQAGGVYSILHARLTATYSLLKGEVERVEERAYCSHLEGGS